MPGQATIAIKENQWTVWVANTTAELTTGLSGRESIGAGTGMLFVLPAKQQVTVDTTNLLFPIDIIFISESTVIDVARNIQPGYLVTEETLCDAFLEVNAGEAEGIEVGDTVSVEIVSTGGFDFSQIISFAIPLAALGFVCAMVGGMARLMGGHSSSSEVRRLGRPRTEEERAKVHKEFYGTREAPARGTGLKERGQSAEDRRLGEPKTEAERREAHERKYGTTEVPERGKGVGHPSSEEEATFPVEAREDLTFCKHMWELEKTIGRPFTREEVSERWERWKELRYRPKTEEERRLSHSLKYGTEELPERGKGLGEHHSMWLTLEERKELEKKYGMVAVRWAEEATKPGDIKAAERAAEYYYGKVKEALGLGHLSPELSEEQIMKLREVLGLPADVAEVLKIHQETGYIP